MLRGYQWSHQLQIIQEFFIITTPIVKLFALGDKQSLHLLRTSNDATKSKQQLKWQNSHSNWFDFCYFSQGILNKNQYKKPAYKSEFYNHTPRTNMITIITTY